MKVRFTTSIAAADWAVSAGQVITVPEKDADETRGQPTRAEVKGFLESGICEAVREGAAPREKAAKTGGSEKATSPENPEK